MTALEILSAELAEQILAFELANRAWFASAVSDRGDDYFDHFADRYSEALAEQEVGIGAHFVLVADDGSVLGRFNLSLRGDGVANLGYRVAQHATGRGVATAAVRQMCGLATTRYGLRLLRAAASEANTASQRVLAKAGFVDTGPAGPADLGGKHGRWYERDLIDPGP